MANNSQVAHQWAAQRKPEGKGSNFYFKGPAIYSYGRHFMAGLFTDVRDKAGKRVVLVNSSGYSMSTSRHMSYVRQSLHGLPVRVIYVPEPGEPWRSVSQMANAYENTLKEAGKARSRRAGLIECAENERDALAEFCELFGQKMPDLSPISDELLAAHGERHKEQLRIERERKAQRQADDEARRIARELPLDTRMAAWRAGGNSVYMHDFPRTLLRLDGNIIYTSRGASVPSSVAPELWKLANYCRKNSTVHTFDYNVHAVGDFSLRSVEDDGSLIVGCHTLEFCELEYIAKELGL